jgi:hypothetical protein
MFSNQEKFNLASKLVETALGYDTTLSVYKKEFLINYVAQIIVKKWEESTINLDELYTDMLRNATHKCTKTMIKGNLNQLYNERQARYERNEDEEREMYRYIDRMLNDSKIKLSEFVHLISQENPEMMSSFVFAEYGVLDGIADILVHGYLDLNKSWFEFDEHGNPTNLNPSSMKRTYSGCNMGPLDGNVESKKRDFLLLLQEYKSGNQNVYEGIRNTAKSEHKMKKSIASESNAAVISFNDFVTNPNEKVPTFPMKEFADTRRHYIVSKNWMGRISVRNSQGKQVSRNIPNYNNIYEEGKILRKRTKKNVYRPALGGKRKSRKQRK